MTIIWRCLVLMMLCAVPVAGDQLVIVGGRPVRKGGIVYAASCASSHVQAALNAMSAGQTVRVPAGTCVWTTTVTAEKGGRLIGAGQGVTTIVSGLSSGHVLVYDPDATAISTNARWELTGFTFDMDGAASGGVWLNNTGATPVTQVIVHRNTFQDTTNDGTCLNIGANGDVWGVAYLNTFINCDIVGRNYGGQDNSWNTTSFTYGTANTFYWESNTFTGNSAFHFGGHGGRYVARFNTYDFLTGTFEVVWDVHGNQPGDIYATMGCEVYQNTVELDRSTTVIDHRGGACLFFQNTTTGTTSAWNVREEHEDTATSNSQPQHVSSSYYFLNTFNGVNQGLTETSDCCGDIAANVDYWQYTASFDGTVGVGSGTLAARPATCTTGVGYWATDQGEWNSMNGGTADGRFYRCVNTDTWELYYTPYTYPHPLRT